MYHPYLVMHAPLPHSCYPLGWRWDIQVDRRSIVYLSLQAARGFYPLFNGEVCVFESTPSNVLQTNHTPVYDRRFLYYGFYIACRTYVRFLLHRRSVLHSRFRPVIVVVVVVFPQPQL